MHGRPEVGKAKRPVSIGTRNATARALQAAQKRKDGRNPQLKQAGPVSPVICSALLALR